MRKKDMVRKMTALLLAVMLCVGLCTDFAVSAEEMDERIKGQTEADMTESDRSEEEAGEQEIPQTEEQGEEQKTAENPETDKETFLPKEEGVQEEQRALENQEEEQSEEQEQTEKQERKASSRASAAGLSDPKIETDSSMTVGQKVTWDCVWFGSYPQSEVTSSDSVYSALQKDNGWENNEITLNGNRYRRMKQGDATHSISNEHYYNWSDSTTWHYFKYEPIKWRVLKNNGNRVLLLSDIVLDYQVYHSEQQFVTWETSTIRSWLNGYGTSANKQGIDYSGKNFISSAFTSGEQSAIVNTSVVNADNTEYWTAGGNDTIDKVFFLSESEVYRDSAKSYGFVSQGGSYDEARRCKSSIYAKAMGAYSSTLNFFKGNCFWSLRSPGKYSIYAAYVNEYGCAVCEGYYVNDTYKGVRPALNLNLSSNQWSYAGTVCSDGTEKETGSGGGNNGSGGETSDTQIEDSIKNALPDMQNLGSTVLKGPELSIAGNEFHLFQTDVKVSLPTDAYDFGWREDAV